jgi:hypothetical protein
VIPKQDMQAQSQPSRGCPQTAALQLIRGPSSSLIDVDTALTFKKHFTANRQLPMNTFCEKDLEDVQLM